jgi:TPR repeat protein
MFDSRLRPLEPPYMKRVICICFASILLISNLSGQDGEKTRKMIDDVSNMRAKAESGDRGAQNTLGMFYEFGLGPAVLSKDMGEAIKWYRKAAEEGFGLAQLKLGGIYKEGKGVPQDYREAAKWYRMAAEAGWASAQTSLADLYAEGHGVFQSYVEAAKWYRMAAEQGDAGGQMDLGTLYFEGKGVPKDSVLAHMWLNLAAAGTKFEELRRGIVEMRDIVERGMSPQEIAEAQRLAREWKPVPAK